MNENQQILDRFKPLNLAESQLIDVCNTGGELKLGQHRPNQSDSGKCIRANLLEEVIKSGFQWIGLKNGELIVRGALIIGDLNIDNADIYFSIHFKNCLFWSENDHYSVIKINKSRMRGFLSLDGCVLNELMADDLILDGNFLARNGFESIKNVSFRSAKISGMFSLSKAKIGLDLLFDNASVKGNFFLKKCTLFGNLNFKGAQIDGSVDLENTEISGNLIAAHAYIGHSLLLKKIKRPLSGADFRLCRAKILYDDLNSWGKGNLIRGFLYENIEYDSNLNSGFRIKWLQNQFCNDGAYNPQPWQHLKKTLKSMGYYTEAREIGIAHEQERRRNKIVGQARGNGWFQHLTAQLTGKLHDLYGFFTAYGYEPVRLLYAMLIVWLFCALIYWGAALGGMMGPTSPLVFQNEKYLSCMAEGRDWTPNIFVKRSDHNWYFCENLPGDYTTFSPLMYSLDLLLPLVDLFQDKDWGVQIPTPRDDVFEEYAAASSQYLVRLVVWLEILFGWMASLMLVAVISGMARNTRDDE